MKTSRNDSNWHFPPDILFHFAPTLVLFPVLVLYAALRQARQGDLALFYVAAALGGIGIVLLFIARLPLYRQGCFFTFGSAALDVRHRRLYRWAYGFIGSSAGLLLLLNLVLR